MKKEVLVIISIVHPLLLLVGFPRLLMLSLSCISLCICDFKSSVKGWFLIQKKNHFLQIQIRKSDNIFNELQVLKLTEFSKLINW